jgi:molecular chaperone GrpE
MNSEKKEEVEKLKEELEALKKSVEELREQNKEYLDGWKRARADYINRERQIEQEKSEWLQYASESLVLKILPIYESLNKSLEHQSRSEDFLRGLEQIKKQFDDFLKGLGVEKIKTIGEKFNPEFHEVVEKRGEGGIIAEEVQAGYTMHGRVIKTAKVIIN